MVVCVAIADVVSRDDRVAWHILEDADFCRTDDVGWMVVLVDKQHDDVARGVVESVTDADSKTESVALRGILEVERLPKCR